MLKRLFGGTSRAEKASSPETTPALGVDSTSLTQFENAVTQVQKRIQTHFFTAEPPVEPVEPVEPLEPVQPLTPVQPAVPLKSAATLASQTMLSKQIEYKHPRQEMSSKWSRINSLNFW